MESEIAPADPLDVDNRKMSDNLSNAAQQPSSPYGAIPNGNANGKVQLFLNHKISSLFG